MQDLFFLQMTSVQADSERWKPKFILPLQNSIYFWFSNWIMTQRLPLFSAPTHMLPVFATTHAEKNPICEYSWALLLLY